MRLVPRRVEQRTSEGVSSAALARVTRTPMGLVLAAGLALGWSGCGCGPTPSGADAGGLDAAVGVDAGRDAGPLRPDAGPGPDGGVDGGAPPRLTRLLPPRGPSAGGAVVMLEGSGFLAGFATSGSQAKPLTSLRFAANPVLDFQIIDDATIELTAPPGHAGAATVTVTNPNGSAACAGCFTYFDELVVTGLSPPQGPVRGGTTLSLEGEGFTADTTVLVGGLLAPRVEVVSATRLLAIAPRGAAPGLVDVVVYARSGASTQRRAYRYLPDVRVTDVTPRTGPLEGGVRVEVTGQGFSGATAVRLGAAAATEVVVSSDGRLEATVPPGAGLGAVDVVVTTPADEGAARGAFAYVALDAGFATYGVVPHVVRPGDVVTLLGQGLDEGALEVRLGGQPALVGARTSSTAQLTVPPRGAAPRRSDVETVLGGQVMRLEAGVTWALEVAALSPNSGPVDGGTSARAEGQGLPPSVRVWVGALEATGPAVTGEARLDFITPAGSGGAASDLVVQEATDPENEAVLPHAFTFIEPLSLARVEPSRGAIAGGTFLTVLGRGFGDATVVSIGDAKAKDVKVLDPHTLTCRAPKGEVGVVDVGLRRLGQQDVLPGGYAYFDPRSISGGLSGGPLRGTLNVTVLESTPTLYGAPVERATVALGVDPATPFQGLTDVRGQVTFSDPSLVRPETVTAFKVGYSAATVAAVDAENVTVFISRTAGGEGTPSPGAGGGVAASSISGRVTGFKSPRALAAHETLEARVFVAQASPYSGPPFGGEPSHAQETWRLTADREEYRVITGAGVRATYAVLGILDTGTGAFTPVTMGVRRGISTSPDNPATGQDIVLDMQLDLIVPVAIDAPVQLPVDGGVELAENRLYAWLELGAEGFIPNPYNWDTGLGASSAVVSSSPGLAFPGFPQLDGSDFIFLNQARGPDTYPSSAFFRRQRGDLRSGVTIGPMLSVPQLVEPKDAFHGTIAWTMAPGGTPDLHSLTLLQLTPLGALPVWTMVLPGEATGLELPQAAVEALRAGAQGASLYLVVTSVRTPKFSYSQWTYGETLSYASWSSFTTVVTAPFLP